MKKILVVALTTVLTATMLCACGKNEVTSSDNVGGEIQVEALDNEADTDQAEEVTADETTDNETVGKAEGDTFTVGFDAEFPPYGYMDENGEYVGFDLSLAEEVCNRNGWELVKQPIEWSAKDMELSSGSIDCIWNGFTMNGRENDYTWSFPYVDNSQVFVVAKDSGITTFEDLAGKVVGVQSDSSALGALTAEEENDENLALTATFATLNQFGDYNTAFMDLEAGAIDAIAMDIGVAKFQLESRNGEFVMLDQLLATEQYGIGFLLGNTALKDQVEATLNEMVSDGTFARIAEEYGLSDSVCLTNLE